MIDLQATYQVQKEEIDTVFAGVFSSGWYILGRKVDQFEAEFADFCHSSYAAGAASGTDTLLLALKAFDIGRGDEVITVAHTAVATVTAIVLSGAEPVFVDVDPITFTLNTAPIEARITTRTKAIISVHLNGHPAELNEILRVARANDLLVIEDCAQAYAARYRGRIVGSIGNAGAFSFYPTRNLGATGDGGAITCGTRKSRSDLKPCGKTVGEGVI